MKKQDRKLMEPEWQIVGPMMRMIEERNVSHEVAMSAAVTFAAAVAVRISKDKDYSFFGGFDAADTTKESIGSWPIF